MADYASFLSGNAQYPLAAPATSFLYSVDKPLFYLLEFFAAMLTTHLGTAFMAEATAAGSNQISAIVADVLPMNPEPFLAEDQFKFPLLAAYRKSSKFRYQGQRKVSVDSIDVAYVLPPLHAGEAERLLPALKAVAAILDNRTEQGFDPTYTPSTPTGTAGENVWARAGISRIEVTDVSYGSYAPAADLFFPAVILTLDIEERSDVAVTEFGYYDGVDVQIDLKDPGQQTLVTHVDDLSTPSAPTLASISPTSGTKAGGTAVTLTGTFTVGFTPTVKFGNVAATNVVVVNGTTITCKTPAHDAFPTFAADVVVTNADGQSATLTAAYTFN